MDSNRIHKRSKYTRWMPEHLRLWCKVAMIVTAIAATLFSLVAFYYFSKAKEYDIHQVAKQQQFNKLLDYKGAPLLGSKAKQETLVTANDLPQQLVDALIAREDTQFESHYGIDLKGLIRATVRNIKDLSFTQGASTITMQLARNTYGIRAKSLHRKFLEIALTFRIEQHYSKADIMAYYLNCIYFGSGCYGVEQAAQKYFKKTTKNLNLSESATLVGIIRGPHIFSPLNNLKAAEQERNQVLKRMAEIGKISPSVAENTIQTPLHLPKKSKALSKNITPANGYALNALERHLNEVLSKKDILTAGLTIHSTFDLDLLTQCHTGLKELAAMTNDDTIQAACIVLNHQTGAIRALSGGLHYHTSPLNRALDGSMELGDVFTPFIYAAALERGKIPIKGKPIQTGNQLGSKEMLRIANRFGFKNTFHASDIFHGRGMASPLQLATAFSTIANQGARPRTYFIQSIEQANGITLFKNQPELTQAIQKGSAQECLKLLRKKKYTYQYTTSAFKGKALWSMAANDKLTAVLWIGFDKPKPLPNRDRYYSKMNQLTYEWVN